MASSATGGSAVKPAQWTSLQHLYPAYKKSTEVFIRWVCRHSDISIRICNNGAGSRVSLEAFSGGVKAIAARGIHMPIYVRSALDKSITLRNQATSIYQEFEGTKQSDATKRHEYFTKKLVDFKKVLDPILPHPKYLVKVTASHVAKSGGCYDILGEICDGTAIDETDEAEHISKEPSEIFDDQQIIYLEEDGIMADLAIQWKTHNLVVIVDQVNIAFNIHTLSPRSLGKAAWIAIAASHLIRMICRELAKETDQKLENMLTEIRRLFLNEKFQASQLVTLHSTFSAVMKTLDKICANWATYQKIELSPRDAVAYEKTLRKQDLDANEMLELTQRVSSDAIVWYQGARTDPILCDWVPHIPLVQQLLNNIGVPTEGNKLHAILEVVMILQTTATAAKAALDSPIFSVASRIASGFLRSVKTFMNKIPLWIWNLFDVKVVTDLSNIDRLIRQRSGDTPTTATANPWASGSLIIYTLNKLYTGSLPLIHWYGIVGAILHLYNALLGSQNCSSVHVLDTAIAILSDAIFPNGRPPTTNFKRNYDAYLESHTAGAPEKMAPTKSKSKGKRKTKTKPTAQPKDKTPVVTDERRPHTVHPSLVMQYPSPDPNEYGDNHFMSSLYAANAVYNKGIQPFNKWSPLTLITEVRTAAIREFDGDQPRAAINIFAIFCVCVEVLDGLRAAWGLSKALTGNAWVGTTVEKVGRVLEELDGGDGNTKVGGMARELVGVLETFREKNGKEVFWELD